MKIKTVTSLIIFFSILIQSNLAFSRLLPDSLNFKTSPIANIEIEYPYIRHLGNFGKVWSNSQGLQIGYGLNYGNQYMLMFKSGYLKTKTRNGVNADSSLKVIPLIIDGKYLFNYGRFKPYFSISSGFNLIFGEYIERSSPPVADIASSNETFFKFYFQIGTGTYIKIYQNINLNLGIKYNAHFYMEDAMMTGFEYSIGLSYNLNKLLF